MTFKKVLRAKTIFWYNYVIKPDVDSRSGERKNKTGLTKMKKTLLTLAAALAMASFVNNQALAEKDPNPYTSYGAAMRNDKNHPSAVTWQGANKAAIEAATSKEAIAKIVASKESMAALLAKVKAGYATDPVAATQIAAVSQKVMCTKCPKAPKCRDIWTAELISAAKAAGDAYVKMYYLDQLRWCGKPCQVDQVKAIGKDSGNKAVADFAEMVAKEMAAGK